MGTAARRQGDGFDGWAPWPATSSSLADAAAALLLQVEARRLEAAKELSPEGRATLGQVFTPLPVADLMARMVSTNGASLRLLDPGAGVGCLFATTVARLVTRPSPPAALWVTAYEVDPALAPRARQSLEGCAALCAAAGVPFDGEVLEHDFLTTAAEIGQPGLWASEARAPYDVVVMNPPYRKIGNASRERHLLRLAGVEVSNLYAGFLAIAARHLTGGAELVAICPRSFCNGPYFTAFRRGFLSTMALRRIHLFDSRDTAFADAAVLQENVILQATKGGEPTCVAISTSTAADAPATVRTVAYDAVVQPGDVDAVIHLTSSELEAEVVSRIAGLPARLKDLRLAVSTGRVVEFRARGHLRPTLDGDGVPLIHPANCRDGRVAWPDAAARRPQCLQRTEATTELCVPNGVYVLVKRFTSKEQARRVVAAVHRPEDVPGGQVAFENHLNYFHEEGEGLDPTLAHGLAAYLNSTLLDLYLRQFSGHTQVNAADLRKLPYPSRPALCRLGERLAEGAASQADLDTALREELFGMSDGDPVVIQRRIEEAQAILSALELPRAQQNRLSALTLLAFLDLRPEQPWSASADPLRGIDQVIAFIREAYHIEYATGTRESIRRQTVHQFQQAGLLVKNPDDPDRAVNSQRTVYQLEPGALALCRSHDTDAWEAGLNVYRAARTTLAARYAQVRDLPAVPVRTPQGERFSLVAGEHNELIREIVETFAPRFTPGAVLLYAGDAASKFVWFPDGSRAALERLGVALDVHGKLPDVVLYHEQRNWLVLVEAVTSHGPIDPMRKTQLAELFAGSAAQLVFVTAFLKREHLAQSLHRISWETEVWIAEAPTHMVHFDGEHYISPQPGGEEA